MIPKHVTIGRRLYTVQLVSDIDGERHTMGVIEYGPQRIQIRTTSVRQSVPRAAQKQRSTFWHELTHGILYDMGHKLHSDERFVTQFSNRLHKAIESARF